MPTKHSNTIIMIEGALCIALAVVLSKVDLFRMPQGGSVDFELVPLLLFTYRRGLKWGARAGALTGIMKLLIGGEFFNVIQFLLDYPLAFAFVGLAAVPPKILGLILAAAGQIACSVVSGAVFFAQYAPEGQNPWVYSLFYNVPVLGVKYIISGIAALILWKALDKALPVSK